MSGDINAGDIVPSHPPSKLAKITQKALRKDLNKMDLVLKNIYKQTLCNYKTELMFKEK